MPTITAKFQGWCFACKGKLASGTQIFWDPSTKKSYHNEKKCLSPGSTGTTTISLPTKAEPKPEIVPPIRAVNNVYPAPEVFGDSWEVSDIKSFDNRGGALKGFTDLGRREMTVPLDDSDVSEYIRAHEMAHAAITPKIGMRTWAEKAGVSVRCLQVAEDMRVNWFLYSRNVERQGGWSKEDIQKVGPAVKNIKDDYERLYAMASTLVQAIATNSHNSLYGAFYAVDKVTAEAAQKIAMQAWSVLVSNQMQNKCLVPKAAEDVARLLKDFTTPPEKKKREDQEGLEKLSEAELKKILKSNPDKDKEKADESRTSAEWQETEAHRIKISNKGIPRWAKMTTIKLPLKEIHRAGQAKKKFASDNGDRIRQLHRYATDGKIFTHKRRTLGGSCVIDCSGSMGLSHDTIKEIVEMAPASKIAIYAGGMTRDARKVDSSCGFLKGGGEGCWGALKIIADNGRISDLKDCHVKDIGGNNSVDGPALRWLARQPLPRYWVSDGQVVGCCNSQHPFLYFDVRALMRKHYIYRFNNMEELKIYIRKQRIKLNRRSR